MKLVAIVFVCTIACLTTQAQPGLAFSVKPGLVLNAAQIGYKADNFFLGGGLEFASVSFSTSIIYEDESGTSRYSDKFDVSVFLPQVAARAYFGSIGSESREAGYARPFAGASLFYSLACASVTESDGETTRHDTTMEKTIRDLLGGNLGGTLVFGGEYYIARGLALSGEFGVRYLFGGAKSTYDYYDYKYTVQSKLGLGVTYTALGLNFYF